MACPVFSGSTVREKYLRTREWSSGWEVLNSDSGRRNRREVVVHRPTRDRNQQYRRRRTQRQLEASNGRPSTIVSMKIE